MAIYTPGLVWPRSDGDPSTWPSKAEQIASTTNNYWRQLAHDEGKYELYENAVGNFIAGKLGIKAASLRMPLPSGYALFAHHRIQLGGAERVDIYLFGSRYIGKYKFRSTKEFLPHAEWLFETSKALDKHSDNGTQCGCLYNKQSEIAGIKKAGGGSLAVAGPSKRPASSSAARTSKKSKGSTADDSESEDEHRSAVVHERELDMTTGRRFRKGELVWFKTPLTTKAPPGRDLPAITHWPGLVSAITPKTRPVTSNPLEATTSAWKLFGAVVPAELQTEQKTVQYREYTIRALGMFSAVDQVFVREQELLPWAMGNELLRGPSGWKSLGTEGTRVMSERVRKEMAADKAEGHSLPADDQALDKRWKKRWAERIPFRELPDDWDNRVFRLSVALKTASAITEAWAQTDKIQVLPDDDINAEDLEAILKQAKSLYQGLWWGGERIWLEDMVRLRKNRSELPEESLGTPSEGAAGRAVFLRIRMIAIELSPDNKKGGIDAYRCLLYGDVFELKHSAEVKRLTTPSNGNGEVPLMTVHTPTRGFEYFQLNDAGSEVTVDIMDVAGRVYPDLLDATTQLWLRDPNLTTEENALRTIPGESAYALMGLRPGPVVASRSDKWKEDLYDMVSEAQRGIEAQMKRYYAKLLKDERRTSGGGDGATGAPSGMSTGGKTSELAAANNRLATVAAGV